MKRLSIITLIFSALTQSGWSVSYVHLNNSDSISIQSLPTEIVFSCDVASIGNKITCEIFQDINANGQIDAYDPRVYFHYFIDGLGNIQDGESKKDIIIGDETGVDGVIRSILLLEELSNPGSPQNWLVRVIDLDNSLAVASVSWMLPAGPTQASGRVIDKTSGKALSGVLITFANAGTPNQQRRAITNAQGEYTIELRPGDWTVYAAHPSEKLYKDTNLQELHQYRGQRIHLDFAAQSYRTFLSGKVAFESGEPVADVSVILQNSTDLKIYHGRTDEDGCYRIGVDPGDYSVTINQYFAKYLGNDIWPDGFYAQPESVTLHIPVGSTCERNFQFSPYPAVINGVCSLNGAPLQDVLIQGISYDPETKKQELFQTFSQADGSYSLGVKLHVVTSLFAQKQGLYSLSLPDVHNLDMKEETVRDGMDFKFDKQATLMSLSGRLTDEQNNPINGAYVAAFNEWENGPDGHLISRSDENGEYFIDVKCEGDWRLGVFTADRHPSPSMYYKYLSSGVRYTNLDFVLTDDKARLARSNGQLRLADFYVMPHLPDPFFKGTTIDFILPQSSLTEVEVLSIDGKQLVTLIDEQLSRGYQKIRWDGKDGEGNIIGSGVYLCRVKSEQQTSIQPITLLK